MSDPSPPDVEAYYNLPGYTPTGPPVVDDVFDMGGFVQSLPVIEGPPASTTP